MAGKKIHVERLSAIGWDNFHRPKLSSEARSGGGDKSGECVCAYRVIGAKNINGGRSGDLGEGRICVCMLVIAV